MQLRVFKVDSEPGKALRDWWVGLENNKGDRAALRRSGTITEVIFIPAFHDLCVALQRCGDFGPKPERLPAVAGLLAQVKSDPKTARGGDRPSLPVQMASDRKSGAGPHVSDLRFRRLLQCRTVEELFPSLRRVIRLLDNRVDIYSLAESVYFWDAYFWGDRIRKEWAYDYYGILRERN